MPYIVIKSNGQEVHRSELDRGVVIGRAPDCDITVHDILLSRRHCRLQPSDDGWMVQDLQSKNGTVFNGETLRTSRLLKDNDVVRLGRSKIIFHAGLPEEDFAENILAPARPATPGDTLSGTLSGFTLLLPGEGDIPDDMPNPQPRPKNPAAYDKEELQTLLTAIASSSWDSVYAEARQPIRDPQTPERDEEVKERRRIRPSSPTDFSLQVNQVATAPAPVIPEPKPRRKRELRVSLYLAVGTIWVGLLMLLNLSQKPMVNGSAAAVSATVAPPQNAFTEAPDSNTAVDGDIVKAADQEMADSPDAPQAPATMKFDAQAAKRASAIAALYLPLIW